MLSILERVISKRREMTASLLVKLIEPEYGSCLEIGGPSPGFQRLSNVFKLFIILNSSRSHMHYLFEDSISSEHVLISDGHYIPLKDQAVDYSFCNALIEHIYPHTRHLLISEMKRVSRKGIIVCSPNKLFPVEFHFLIPFIQFMPSVFVNKVIRYRAGLRVGADDHIDLLTPHDLLRLMGFDSCIYGFHYILGIPASLIGVWTRDIAWSGRSAQKV